MSSQLLRILIIEDDSQWAQTLFNMLEDEEASFEIVHARSLEAGMTVLCAQSIDLLLVDSNALDDGISYVGRIHAQSESLPIIVLIGQEEEAVRTQFVAVGASDCLSRAALSSPLLKKVLNYAVERKRAESALRQSEERFQELFENARDIIFSLDLEGNFTSINRSAEEVMGWSREEARKINLRNLVAPEHLDLCSKMMSGILNEEHLQQFEISVFRRDGKKVFLEVTARLIQSEGKKKGVQGIARDVTERRNLENMVRQSQKLDAIGLLSGGLAHDFNNLLCIISGHVELLSEQLAPDHPGIKNVAPIKKAVESASIVLRQLLAFSRKQVFHPQTLDLNSIVAETEKLLGRLIGEHIELFTSLHPALGLVCVDPVQIEQVIVNLVLNARDAMPKGGRLAIETSNVHFDEDCHFKRAIIPAGKYVMLAVTDNGTGMDEETQNRIFEPFYTTKEVGKGTGLGLATVYGIVKQSGGTIGVNSEPGQGTTFKIYFPCVDPAIADEAASEPEPEDRQGSETVLLVEDAEALRALIKEFLRSSGYSVLQAENGAEAIEIASSFGGPIHLLLTDVIMPGMGGKQLAQKFANLRPTTKILYMSGYSDEGIVNSGLPGTEMAFLEKPFTRDMLLRKVRRVLGEEHHAITPGW